MIHNCSFCDQIHGVEAGDELARLLGHSPYRRTFIAENTLGVVFPSIGPLAIGHVLVCPRRHAASFAELDVRERLATSRLMRRAEALLERATRSPVIAFEHGTPADRSSIACSIEHAHVHVLPWSGDEIPSMALDWADLETEDLAGVTRGREYLRVQHHGTWRIAFPSSPDGFESQLMRRALERSPRPQAWDWRTNPRTADVQATMRLLEVPSAIAA